MAYGKRERFGRFSCGSKSRCVLADIAFRRRAFRLGRGLGVIDMHIAHETESTLVSRADQGLCVAIVVDRAAGGADPRV